jgi:hypothetical protein
MAKTSADLVAEAKQRVQYLTVDQVAVEIEQGDALLVDLREPSERQEQGAIPGAVHAPRGMLEFWADPTSAYHRTEFDPNRRVIVHCAGEDDPLLLPTHFSKWGMPTSLTSMADLTRGRRPTVRLRTWNQHNS